MRTYKKILSRRAGMVFLVFLLLNTFNCRVDDDIEPLAFDTLPGIEYLGRGYDFFGEYADVSAVKSPLIDLENYTKEVNAFGVTYAIPEAVDFILYNKNEISSIYGQTIQDYQRNLSISAGVSVKCFGFRASVKTNFAEQYYSHSDFQFTTVKNLISRWRLSLPFDIPTLQGMLTEAAAEDLESLAPDLLFKKYGHFLLTEAVIGARADYSASALRTEELSSTEFQIRARASYSWLTGGASASFGYSDSTAVKNFRNESVVNLITKGGASQYGQAILEGDYGPWINSVDYNPVLCDFTQRSLIPIWELCKSPTRKAELEQYFEQLGESEAIPPPSESSMAITEIEIIKVERPAGIDADNPNLAQIARRQKPGWRILETNMNNNECDMALFLAFREESPWSSKSGYCDLFVVYDVDTSIKVPTGYRAFTNANLNDKCGAKTTNKLYYLPWSTGGEPIRGLRIEVISDTEPNPIPPEGYVWVLSDIIEPANLDWRLNGSRKYLAYTTHSVPSGGIWEPTFDPDDR
ncbi:MAG: hypothetical protein EP344_17110 [Bacteroidetes bacterium]|nr:MAG: hypothetical protein EP344_17110 [Bacteroidota bacterium]